VLRLEPPADGIGRTLLAGAWYVRAKVTGQVLTFWSIAISVGLYILVSLATCRTPFDLDRMLHRDERKAEGETAPRWWERLGFDRRMTGWDRFVTAITIAWPLFFTAVFAVGMARHLLGPRLGLDPLTDGQWLEGWGGWLTLAFGTAALVTIWFLVGGIRDLVRMFRLLDQARPDARDDGRVENHRNADEMPAADSGDRDS
jgi:SSS family solute:Na+ symporter